MSLSLPLGKIQRFALSLRFILRGDDDRALLEQSLQRADLENTTSIA